MNLHGTAFWGCKFPPGIEIHTLMKKGAQILTNPDFLPFKPFRAFMYTQEELLKTDQIIFSYYKKSRTLQSKIFEAIHDYSMENALDRYLENKTGFQIFQLVELILSYIGKKNFLY